MAIIFHLEYNMKARIPSLPASIPTPISDFHFFLFLFFLEVKFWDRFSTLSENKFITGNSYSCIFHLLSKSLQSIFSSHHFMQLLPQRSLRTPLFQNQSVVIILNTVTKFEHFSTTKKFVLLDLTLLLLLAALFHVNFSGIFCLLFLWWSPHVLQILSSVQYSFLYVQNPCHIQRTNSPWNADTPKSYLLSQNVLQSFSPFCLMGIFTEIILSQVSNIQNGIHLLFLKLCFPQCVPDT